MLSPLAPLFWLVAEIPPLLTASDLELLQLQP
jgi:hypothetical protein